MHVTHFDENTITEVGEGLEIITLLWMHLKKRSLINVFIVIHFISQLNALNQSRHILNQTAYTIIVLNNFFI